MTDTGITYELEDARRFRSFMSGVSKVRIGCKVPKDVVEQLKSALGAVEVRKATTKRAAR
jgi:hypothetical protein